MFFVPSVQCVPYLIAMGTDPEPSMRNKADQQLVEIDKKYTGFIHVSRFSMLSSFKFMVCLVTRLLKLVQWRSDDA